MVGAADFKGIFNFKPCSPCEMKLSGPDTVLPVLPLEAVYSSFFQAFVVVAFKWQYSPTGWPNEGVLLSALEEKDINSWNRLLKQY